MGANARCKTNLVRGHVRDAFDDKYISTLGTKVSKKEMLLSGAYARSPITVDMLVWDVLSPKNFRGFLWDAYFHGARGVIAVSDMTRRSTLDDLDEWIQSVRGIIGRVPVVIIGANFDKKDRLEVSEQELVLAAKAHDAPCYFASESSTEPVEAAFRFLADAVLRSMLPRGGDEPLE